MSLQLPGAVNLQLPVATESELKIFVVNQDHQVSPIINGREFPLSDKKISSPTINDRPSPTTDNNAQSLENNRKFSVSSLSTPTGHKPRVQYIKVAPNKIQGRKVEVVPPSLFTNRQKKLICFACGMISLLFTGIGMTNGCPSDSNCRKAGVGLLITTLVLCTANSLYIIAKQILSKDKPTVQRIV